MKNSIEKEKEENMLENAVGMLGWFCGNGMILLQQEWKNNRDKSWIDMNNKLNIKIY